MINKSTFDTIHAGKFVLHSYLINDINGCKGTIYIRRHCLLHYIIIMRFLCLQRETEWSRFKHDNEEVQAFCSQLTHPSVRKGEFL